eukprot:Transcript_28228.p1 GENE.Transcript_28228~~Transcript_28228.p1  ORF type:complete len:107 (-),score=10.35 Transcript_28228:153-473(-)
MDQWISSYCVSAPRASRADEEGEEGEVEEETVAPLTTEEKLEELNQQLREGSIGPHQFDQEFHKLNALLQGFNPESRRSLRSQQTRELPPLSKSNTRELPEQDGDA